MPRARTELAVPQKPPGQVPHIFGRGVRDRLLMTLAVNARPLYVSELARLLSCAPSKMRKTVKVLEATNIISSKFVSPSLRFIGLNRDFPGYLRLVRFLRVLETHYPQERVGKPKRTAERLALRGLNLSGNGCLAVTDIDRLFYSSVRTRTLLTVVAVGDTDVRDIQTTVGLDHRSIWNAVNHWQREGIIRSVVRGRRRALELDPRFPAAEELRLFLQRLVVVTEEYEGLARLSTRRRASPRFVAER
jgi:DNA-binding Lrp family transcriptional regulator